MNVLILDNTILKPFWGSADLVRSVFEVSTEATIHVRRPPHGDCPKDPKAFDRIVISGSLTSAMDQHRWVLTLEAFLSRAIESRIPTLGICFGHQMLGRCLGGNSAVRKAAQLEMGWSVIQQTAAHPLLEKLPKEFRTFSSHYDEVSTLPPEALVTASSELCKVQAFYLKDRPVYGLQFHPERNAEEGEATLQSHFRSKPREPVIGKGKSKALYDPRVSREIFKAFLA